MASGRFFFHFREVYQNMYRIYRKILNSDQGDFQILVKSGMFWKKLRLNSGRFPEDQGGFTCMSI